ncbi:aldolase [Aulographum hederae CBS 113979]|uniref:Aldolase n=1 Tax=Aulographum hederae CBS 113979 TaxID=1176131 RepID=A0A6G1GWK4_9PEZI|nr:aldolase [Aulographum hederae CBS 113979]
MATNGVNGHTNGAANGHTNGDAAPKVRTPLRAGIYSPTMTFFDPDTEDLDIPSIRRHAVRLAEAGLVGLVTMGSNGEAVHLSKEEKSTVTQETRSALDDAGFSDVPVIVGASENSIKGTIELCKHSASAGGEYVLLVPPSYYRYAMDEDALYEYFTKVADGSPLPIILYNYPGAVAGIDMDSDFLIKLAKHPNIVGTKFTCGNTGKLTRVALATNAVTSQSEGSGYMAFGGMADFTAQTSLSGGSGIIAGGANVIPKTCVKVWELASKGQWEEASKLQQVLSKGDWVLTKAAIPGTKSAIQTYYGYGGFPRRPLKRLGEAQVAAVAKGIEEVMAVEKAL